MRHLAITMIIGLLLSFSWGCKDKNKVQPFIEPIIEPSLVASFTPSDPDPDSMDVTLQQRSQNGDSFTVDVVITGVNDVYSVQFHLGFDSTLLDYLNYTEGTFLNQNGEDTFFSLSEATGKVLVLAGRLQNVGGANAAGDEILMSIAFRVKKAGSAPVSFQSNYLLDSSGNQIDNLTWSGGEASGS